MWNHKYTQFWIKYFFLTLGIFFNLQENMSKLFWYELSFFISKNLKKTLSPELYIWDEVSVNLSRAEMSKRKLKFGTNKIVDFLCIALRS